MALQAYDAHVAMQEYATFIQAQYPEEFVWRGGEMAAMAQQISRGGSLLMIATIGALAWSPDGASLAAGDEDGGVEDGGVYVGMSRRGCSVSRCD